jgi:transposase
MVGSFYTFFVEVSQHLLNSWIAGSRQVLALLGAGGRRRSTLAVVGPVLAGGAITVSEGQRRVLEALVRRSTAPQRLVRRAQMILMLAAGKTFNQVARALGGVRHAVYKWCNRWRTQAWRLAEMEAQACPDRVLSRVLEGLLMDAYRAGKPATFSPEQIVKLIAVACEQPQDCGRPIRRWSSRELAAEVVKRGIVKTIARSTVSQLLKEAKIKPHLSRYWLNAQPEDPAAFDAQVRAICALYRQATQLHKLGIHLVSTDEKTGIQALQHKYPAQPVKAGQVARIEHKYDRHGTLCLIANLEVATGRIVAPSVGPRRTEADFLAHIQQTVALAPQDPWLFMVDNLNSHQSASLVEWVAQQCGIAVDLGVKDSHGILKSMASRAAFLADPSHRVRFVYTPKHTSWLNQVEIWFSILVGRLLKRASFDSIEELHQALINFIEYFNATMAKPFKWTYAGKPLTV